MAGFLPGVASDRAYRSIVELDDNVRVAEKIVMILRVIVVDKDRIAVGVLGGPPLPNHVPESGAMLVQAKAPEWSINGKLPSADRLVDVFGVKRREQKVFIAGLSQYP